MHDRSHSRFRVLRSSETGSVNALAVAPGKGFELLAPVFARVEAEPWAELPNPESSDE